MQSRPDLPRLDFEGLIHLEKALIDLEATDRFEVIRPHAEGGVGTISVALDRELNREVALKQIHAEQADDPACRDRFLLEAEITGGLEHPGIVPVYSLGHQPDGRPFYAMRLIRGETLADAIDRFHDPTRPDRRGACRLGLRKLLRRFMDVCNAIEYAHGRGVLHRDLKPSNIMLVKHGETLVVDWGLAKAIGADEPELVEEGPLCVSSWAAETLPGSAVGTPSFMSPEQAEGRTGDIGPRTDVYSLGATLYCLLTGKSPFGPDEPARILQAVREGDFPRPRLLKVQIPDPLEAVCLKAMALAPDDRYGSARELADDIERWMADEPISAFVEPFSQRIARWSRRHRTTVAAAVGGLIVATVALCMMLAFQSRSNEQLRESGEIARRMNNEFLASIKRESKTSIEIQAAGRRDRARFELALDALRTFHNDLSDDLQLREAEFAGLRFRLLVRAMDCYRKLESELDGRPDQSSREAMARVYGQIAQLQSRFGSSREELELRRTLAHSWGKVGGGGAKAWPSQDSAVTPPD